MSIFDCFDDGSVAAPPLKIKKPVRLIETFSGIGATRTALRRLGVPFESWKTAEWNVNSVISYCAIHEPESLYGVVDADGKHHIVYKDYSSHLSYDEIVEKLSCMGWSKDGKTPFKGYQKWNKRNEAEARLIYNAYFISRNLGSVCNFHAADMKIEDRDKYTYILTYSFPCQDLSLAGSMCGMQRGSNTRSGLLWEIERLLQECRDEDCLPQILLMENVTQVHGRRQIEDGSWNDWLKSLENLGYTNYWKDMNSKNYGVAQNRDRCFMVSVLGNYSYEFPEPIELKYCMKDYLDEKVDDKYFIAEERTETLIHNLIDDGRLDELTGIHDNLAEQSRAEQSRAEQSRAEQPISPSTRQDLSMSQTALPQGKTEVSVTTEAKVPAYLNLRVIEQGSP